MHKSLYKFIKTRNKCNVTIKSTITKITISGKNKWLKQYKKSIERETKLERERESIDLFCYGQLERNRGGVEMK